jgi:hypothetical protein
LVDISEKTNLMDKFSGKLCELEELNAELKK